MEHFQSIEDLRLSACSLTIGAFDGVHRGHQALIDRLVAAKESRDWPGAVLTFFPHPSVVLGGRQPSFYLTSPEEKAELLGKLGVDIVVTQRFDLALSKVSAGEFLDLLEAHLAPRELWVGPDFALGHQREGNIPYLRRASKERGFELYVVEPLNVGGEIISSTRIRESLRAGDVARAATYLGRYFSLVGKITRGTGRGKDLGIPTANLDIWEERAYPRNGVYACFADIDHGRFQAVANIGKRPTFDGEDTPVVVEAHLLDFSGDLYGEEVRVEFVERLRDELRFESVEALMGQIDRDIAQARRILGDRLEAAGERG